MLFIVFSVSGKGARKAQKNTVWLIPQRAHAQTWIQPSAPVLYKMKFRTLQTQNSPGRWAQVPCSAAETAEFPRSRGQPPPHPLAPRAFAFAWRVWIRRGQTRRAKTNIPHLLRIGCLRWRFYLVRLPCSCGYQLSVGRVFFRFFRRFHHPIRTPLLFQA